MCEKLLNYLDYYIFFMHSFQQLPLEFVSLLFKTLPLHEVRELRRTDKWFNHCILNLVPRIRTTHIIWTG